VLISGWPPNKLTRSAHPFVILKRTFNHVRLLQCGVLVQWHDRTRIEFEQSRGDTSVIRVEHFDLDSWKLGGLPSHFWNINVMRGALRWVFKFDVGMYDLAILCGHGELPTVYWIENASPAYWAKSISESEAKTRLASTNGTYPT